jgi:hypothetical protein
MARRFIRVRAGRSVVPEGNVGDIKFLVDVNGKPVTFVRASSEEAAKRKIRMKFPRAMISPQKFRGTTFAFNVKKKQRR